MDSEILLLSSFISLVGLQFCVPKNEFEKLGEAMWTNNPLIKIFYGLNQLLGVVFVLGCVGYLTFTQKWWFFLLAYFVGLAVSSFLASLIQHFIDSLFIRRILGTIIIIIGYFIFFINS